MRATRIVPALLPVLLAALPAGCLDGPLPPPTVLVEPSPHGPGPEGPGTYRVALVSGTVSRPQQQAPRRALPPYGSAQGETICDYLYDHSADPGRQALWYEPSAYPIDTAEVRDAAAVAMHDLWGGCAFYEDTIAFNRGFVDLPLYGRADSVPLSFLPDGNLQVGRTAIVEPGMRAHVRYEAPGDARGDVTVDNSGWWPRSGLQPVRAE